MKKNSLLMLIGVLSAGSIVSCTTVPTISSKTEITSESSIVSEESSSQSSVTSESSSLSSSSEISSTSTSSSESHVSSSSSADNSSSSSSIETPVQQTIIATIIDPNHLFDGNPLQSVNSEDYSAVVPNERGQYEFVIGAIVKIKMSANGALAPTGALINGVVYKINADGFVTFVVAGSSSSTDGSISLTIEATYEDTTPTVKEYSIQLTNSDHITMECFIGVGKIPVDSCDMNDEVKVKITESDGYKLKEISGYTVTDKSTGSKRTLEFKYNEDEGVYVFKCPFSSDKIIRISVTEIDATAFKDSDLIGEYLVLRTYGFSESQTNVRSFANNLRMTFNESGEFIYSTKDSSTKMYATSNNEKTVTVNRDTSTFDVIKGKNMLMFGEHNGFTSAKASGITDFVFAIKLAEKTSDEDYNIKISAFKNDSTTYGIFEFYLKDTLYASCYINNKNNNEIYPDATATLFNGENIYDDKAVFDVTAPDNTKLLSVGYTGDGGKDDRSLITNYENGYTNENHTLVFFNNEGAIYDGIEYKMKAGDGTVELTSAVKRITLKLNEDKTFAVLNEEDIVKSALDIANKVFTGSYNDNWTNDGNPSLAVPATITFGPSNDEITGHIIQNSSPRYYWKFSATFDDQTNILLCTVTDRGYGGNTANTWPSIGKTFEILLEDGALKFKDSLTGNSAADFKNCVFTCPDFKL